MVVFVFWEKTLQHYDKPNKIDVKVFKETDDKIIFELVLKAVF